MLGENEDFYAQSYIRTQSIGIACESLLMLQSTSGKCRENGGQRTTAQGGDYSNAGCQTTSLAWP